MEETGGLDYEDFKCVASFQDNHRTQTAGDERMFSGRAVQAGTASRPVKIQLGRVSHRGEILAGAPEPNRGGKGSPWLPRSVAPQQGSQ